MTTWCWPMRRLACAVVGHRWAAHPWYVTRPAVRLWCSRCGEGA